ncbi:MAG: ribonuclease P component 1 family protein [Nanobdellota archaeon]
MEDRTLRSYIGVTITITKSANDSYVGLTGIVVDETKNSFLIETSLGVRKRVLKKSSTFSLGDVVVDGDSIMKRPEERIKSRGK